MDESLSSKIHWMRAAGCIAVILLHSAILGNLAKPDWWASNIYGGIPRFAVPLFFMVSGCLLINERYKFDGFIKRRLIRIVPAIIFWDAAYYVWGPFHSKSISSFLAIALEGPVYYHLWFLYALIGAYLSLVVIIPFYNNSGAREKLYFIALWAMLYGALPIATELLDLPSELLSTYSLSMFAEPVGWLVVGAMLRDVIHTRKYRPNTPIATAASLIFLLAILFLTKLYTDETAETVPPDFVSELFRAPPSILTIAYSVSVFMLFCSIQASERSWISKAVAVISDCSFGIYCLHVIVMTEVLRRLKPYIPSSWIIIPTVTTLTFVICLAVTYCARRIKTARYLL